MDSPVFFDMIVAFSALSCGICRWISSQSKSMAGNQKLVSILTMIAYIANGYIQ